MSLLERINDMPGMAGVVPKAAAQAGLDFSRKEYGGDTSSALTRDVHAGGVDGTTRWDSFNAVSGHYIHCLRRGDMTLQEAEDGARGWMLAHMIPPWPEERFQREWRGLLQKDAIAYGPMPLPVAAPAYAEQLPAIGVPIIGVPQERNFFEKWAVRNWASRNPPPRTWLLEGWIMPQAPHLLVAPGGAGKTFSLLELGIKIATYERGAEVRFWGARLTELCEDARVVIITTEDDRHELNKRIIAIDPELKCFENDRLMVFPTTAEPNGSFTICERDPKGNIVASAKWRSIVAHLRSIPNLKLVVLDTLNAVMHGDENSATTVAELRREAFDLCQYGPSLLFTHHIRKLGLNEKIHTPEDMRQATRGSGALLDAFRIGIGIWPAPDWQKRMALMKLEPRPKGLWLAGIIKANNPEVYHGTRTLWRNERGMLVDVTGHDVLRVEERKFGSHEHRAWLTEAIKRAAEAGHPYTRTGNSGLWLRRAELPPALAVLTKRKLDELVNEMTGNGAFVFCAPEGSKTKTFLDVGDGPLAGNVGTIGADYEFTPGAYKPLPQWDRLEFYPMTNGIVEKRNAHS